MARYCYCGHEETSHADVYGAPICFGCYQDPEHDVPSEHEYEEVR